LVGLGTPSLISGSGAAYSFINNGCRNEELRPEDTCKITLAFKPTKKGHFNATLTIPSHKNGFTEFPGEYGGAERIGKEAPLTSQHY